MDWSSASGSGWRCNAPPSSTSSPPVLDGRECICKVPMLLLTSKSRDNPGRRYWRCRNWRAEPPVIIDEFHRRQLDVHGRGVNVEPTHGSMSGAYLDQQLQEAQRKIMKLQKKLEMERRNSYLLKVVLVIMLSLLGVILCILLAKSNPKIGL